jgi:hypothetical protein
VRDLGSRRPRGCGSCPSSARNIGIFGRKDEPFLNRCGTLAR